MQLILLLAENVSIDGGTYNVYRNTRTGPAIGHQGDVTFYQYFSIRSSMRDCGTINISAHMRKWEELGLKMGKLYEARVLGEAGHNNGNQASGSVDFPHANVFIADGTTPTSSASTNPTSSASTPTSSAAAQTAVGTLPGTIEIEDYQNSDGDFKNNGTTLGSINPDSWVEYTVNVTYDGTYDFSVLAAREDEDGAESNLSIFIDGTPVGTIDGILTTSWTDFQEFSGTTAKLTKGTHTLRVTFDYGWIDIDNITFTEKDVDKTTPYVPPSSASQGNSSGSSKDPAAIASDVRLFHAGKDVQVFDMQGKFLGSVSIANGGNVAQAVKARVQKAGVYLVKQGSSVQRIAVK